MKTQNDRLRRTLESGHFAITAELTPPRGADFRSLQEAIAILGNTVTAVNVTDGAGARVRMSSLAAAIYVREHGLEPIMQMTCRDRNRLALQAEALGAAAHGIHNVLALTGDRPADSSSHLGSALLIVAGGRQRNLGGRLAGLGGGLGRGLG